MAKRWNSRRTGFEKCLIPCERAKHWSLIIADKMISFIDLVWIYINHTIGNTKMHNQHVICHYIFLCKWRVFFNLIEKYFKISLIKISRIIFINFCVIYHYMIVFFINLCIIGYIILVYLFINTIYVPKNNNILRPPFLSNVFQDTCTLLHS